MEIQYNLARIKLMYNGLKSNDGKYLHENSRIQHIRRQYYEVSLWEIFKL